MPETTVDDARARWITETLLRAPKLSAQTEARIVLILAGARQDESHRAA